MLFVEGLPKGWRIDEDKNEDGVLYTLYNPKGEWAGEDVDPQVLVAQANHLSKPVVSKRLIFEVLQDVEERLDELGLTERSGTRKRLTTLIEALRVEMGGYRANG